MALLLTKKLALNLKPNPNLTSTRACTIKLFTAVTYMLVNWFVCYKNDGTGPRIKIYNVGAPGIENPHFFK